MALPVLARAPSAGQWPNPWGGRYWTAGPCTASLRWQADGRDMGTVVFPQARPKIFLTASPAERALRRYKQLKEKGVTANLAALSLEIAERDLRDSTRAASPLVASADAVLLDTTGMSVDAVVERVLEVARRRLSLRSLSK